MRVEIDPKYEYVPDFLTPEDAAELFANLERQRGFVLETGQCKGAKPSHATVQWGPRQAYLSCVPSRIESDHRETSPIFYAD